MSEQIVGWTQRFVGWFWDFRYRHLKTHLFRAVFFWLGKHFWVCITFCRVRHNVRLIIIIIYLWILKLNSSYLYIWHVVSWLQQQRRDLSMDDIREHPNGIRHGPITVRFDFHRTPQPVHTASNRFVHATRLFLVNGVVFMHLLHCLVNGVVCMYLLHFSIIGSLWDTIALWYLRKYRTSACTRDLFSVDLVNSIYG